MHILPGKEYCLQESLHISWTFSLYIIHYSATPILAYQTSRIQTRFDFDLQFFSVLYQGVSLIRLELPHY